MKLQTNVQAHTRASETPELEKEPGGALCDAACSALHLLAEALCTTTIILTP
jgi:hypothetical protein